MELEIDVRLITEKLIADITAEQEGHDKFCKGMIQGARVLYERIQNAAAAAVSVRKEEAGEQQTSTSSEAPGAPIEGT